MRYGDAIIPLIVVSDFTKSAPPHKNKTVIHPLNLPSRHCFVNILNYFNFI